MGANILKKTMASILVFFILLVGIPTNAMQEEYQGVDVFVVLDNSGSMKNNDRENLRFEVVKNFIHMLNLGDSIGVINFNTEIDIKLPISKIKSYEDKELLKKQIKTTPPSMDTDVYAALLTAFHEMGNSLSSNNIKFFILVTDGIIDPGPEYATNMELRDKYFEELDQLINEYEDNIWPIFVVFLNPDGIEDNYLKEIAKRTGGNFYNLDNANQFEEIFDEVLKRIEAIKGDIAKAMESKTWLDVAQEHEIEVDIISPINGKYYYNEKINIEAQILMDDRRLIEDQFTNVDTFAVEIVAPDNNVYYKELNDQGNNGDAKEGDGVYSTSFVPQEKGIYKFGFRVTGGYKGKRFNSISYNDLEILEPMIIDIGIKVSEIQDIMQGKKLKINLDFLSDIDSKQIVEFASTPQSQINVKSIKVAYLPDNPSQTALKIPIPRNIPIGEHTIILSANTFSQGIRVEPDELSLNIMVLPYEFFADNQFILYIILLIVVIVFLIFGYLLFNRLSQKLVRMVRGNIICYEGNKKIKEINLTRARKERIIASSNLEYQPDIFIESEKYFVFNIYTEIDILKTASRFGINYSPRYFVKIDPEGAILELNHGDSFTIGIYRFLYNNKKASMDMGRNVLEKYDIGE